jgi:hypothetical protein
MVTNLNDLNYESRNGWQITSFEGGDIKDFKKKIDEGF